MRLSKRKLAKDHKSASRHDGGIVVLVEWDLQICSLVWLSAEKPQHSVSPDFRSTRPIAKGKAGMRTLRFWKCLKCAMPNAFIPSEGVVAPEVRFTKKSRNPLRYSLRSTLQNNISVVIQIARTIRHLVLKSDLLMLFTIEVSYSLEDSEQFGYISSARVRNMETNATGE